MAANCHAAPPTANASAATPLHKAKRRRRCRRRGSPRAGSAELLLQRVFIGTDALGIDTEIALALAALRPHIDAAAGAVGDDADDHVVGEAHERRALVGLDAAARGFVGD